MKVVADDKIPFLRGVLEAYGVEVAYLPGAKTDAAAIRGADALITRTRTKCNAALLDGSSVRFIATATIGFDHLDTDYLAARKIAWTNAPGCNAPSVGQYVTSVLVNLAVRHRFELSGKTLAVIGVGNVGKQVAARAQALGMKVLLNDPPRARKEGAAGFVTLAEAVEQADVLTFHVPLTKDGSDPTWHLLDEALLSRLRPDQFVFNSSRGEVADNAALKAALKARRIAGAVLDVWENEPGIDAELLDLLDFATPHVAGYSTDGKANGTAMSVRALAKFFGLDPALQSWYPETVPPPPGASVIDLPSAGTALERLQYAVNASYDVQFDTDNLRAAPETFEALRGGYRIRREFPAFTVRNAGDLAPILQKLGFRVK